MKISSLIIGKGSGSAGNITVVQLNGQTILKQKATSVGNPKTALQTKQRNMMNRAVYAWQLTQNGIKQGWTSLLPFSSQYNTYVSENSNFFKDAIFTKEGMTALDLVGSIASKGSLGILRIETSVAVPEGIQFGLNKANLNQMARIGDKIVMMTSATNETNFNYDEVIVTQALLDSNAPAIVTRDEESGLAGSFVTAVFLVSADKKFSSTSEYKEMDV